MKHTITTTQLENIPAEVILKEFSTIRSQLQALVDQTKPKELRDEYLTRDDVASLLKVSKVTIWNWSGAKANILTPHRIGNQVRYLKSEVLAAAKTSVKESQING